MRPHVVRAFRHDVDMRLQDQRAALFLAWAMNADDDRRFGVLLGKRRAAGVARDRLAVHGEALHGVTALAQRAKDEILDRMLLATQGAEAHELLREGDLVGESLLDGSDDAVA